MNNIEFKSGKSENEKIICGDLIFSTANDLLVRGKNLIASSPSIHFNLSQVTHSSSIGLAVLIAWCRTAKQLHKKISFSHLPANLLSAAKVSNLDKILPISEIINELA